MKRGWSWSVAKFAALACGALACQEPLELLPVEPDLVTAASAEDLGGSPPGLEEPEALLSGPGLSRIVVLPETDLPHRGKLRGTATGLELRGATARDPDAQSSWSKPAPRPFSPPAGFHPSAHGFDDSALELEVLPQAVAYDGRAAGVAVRLRNRWTGVIELDTTSRQLDLVQQALAPDGTWRSIEVPAEPWCGPFFEPLVLAPGESYELVAPRFRGSFPTLLRFKLRGGAASAWRGPWPADEDAEDPLSMFLYLARDAMPRRPLPPVYSAPFVGSVQPNLLR